MKFKGEVIDDKSAETGTIKQEGQDIPAVPVMKKNRNIRDLDPRLLGIFHKGPPNQVHKTPSSTEEGTHISSDSGWQPLVGTDSQKISPQKTGK